MPAPLDLSGSCYGRLTCIEPVHVEGQRRWLCRCTCGNTTTVRAAALRNGNTASCGCWKRAVLGVSTTKHGYAAGKQGRTYRIWKAMRNRCLNPRTPRYKDYGGRGIKVCKRWDRFDLFLRDMGAAPPGKSIDRRNNNGNYTPKNCRWATPKEQRANCRKPSI